ncbi:SpoIIIAH-like family protein [Lachnoclostridium sp. An118]|uniref:SpoIIIAH-like family protein n=1 Tax=Lachnoclostridium sp. An118 TaxID=1965547 RepID=UPI000B36E919|nr:SpoIIIAH-like family protein [Lachnoclostridium sp. An118]OUQ52622.1 stage III sporulation protein AH [Lachnoclostridium sp. An118]
MKKIFRKNQIIIAALAVMIAAAGYLNYSGRLFGEKDDATQTSGDLASQELLDISEEDVSAGSDDIESQDVDGDAAGAQGETGDGSVDDTPGEAVLTSGDASAVVAEAKVTREQVRAKNKEDLLSIIDNQNLSDEQKQDAVNQMVQMTDLAEKEAAAETLLASKGFDEAVVSLTADSADVVVNASELSDANRAQIEDIITRKTGIAAQNIVITPINTAE